ncbi:MAG: M20 family metallopeptidase [Betaproteobacteria bacterium]|nr:M20 family metallopeptidase [Betaproteobacteria bacterium]
MTRTDAVARALAHFDTGAFLRDLDRRVAFHTESQEPAQAPALAAYLDDEMIPSLLRLGFTTRVVPNPVAGFGPFLIAHRHESAELPTVFTYGHGDVIRGYDKQWRQGLEPWRITVEGERWYGRGTADNKGQHSINIAALDQVLQARGGKLGFNVKLLIEMGEETGSPGLRELAATLRDELAADVLLASDGPRLTAAQPTVFLGSRGIVDFDLHVNLREGGHHSGNWGGLLRNPATVLAGAIASLVDANGRILVEGLRPPPIPDAVRRAIAHLEVGGGPGDPAVDADWGEPGLTPAERVFGWNALEVLAFKSGNPDNPVNAIPPTARAHCQLRFVVGTDWQNAEQHLRRHLDAAGFALVALDVPRGMPATRLAPDHPWVEWTLRSISRTTGKDVVVLPNLGGTLPNDVFADILGLPTVWIPHSYPGCSQHAPNEHLLAPVVREALEIMTGLFWDMGETGSGVPARRAGH